MSEENIVKNLRQRIFLQDSNCVDDLVKLNIKGETELKKLGLNSREELEKVGVTSNEDLARVGFNDIESQSIESLPDNVQTAYEKYNDSGWNDS